MLDFKYLRDHIDEVREKIEQRGVEVNWESFLDFDISRRELLKEVEDLRYQKNTVSEKISQLKREKKRCFARDRKYASIVSTHKGIG